ncbi:polyprenyl synthetase family protein [Candidatus Microgenomates bacterium]|nr:polyprenyl synthetase family protein [Candidatus Microgenomates bacterium]
MKTPGELRSKINRLLKDFFAKKKKEGQKQGAYYQELIEQIESITLRGGDKMRPLLVYYGYTAVNNKLTANEENQLLAIALCTELFHTACLIHDDVMDQSFTRRGGLTIHQYFSQKYPTSSRQGGTSRGKQNEKLGRDLAILAGDLALVWSDEIFIDQKARKYFNLLREEVIFGQQLDLIGVTDEKSILTMYEYKTAKYSFEGPIHIGLALADAPKEAFAVFSKYAINVGIAFQIRDDILGSFGDPKKTGKSNEDDLREQKNTLLVAYAKCKMKNVKRKIDKKLLVSTGALGGCEKLARRLVKEGKEGLKSYNISSEAKKFFLELADYVVEREE